MDVFKFSGDLASSQMKAVVQHGVLLVCVRRAVCVQDYILRAAVDLVEFDFHLAETLFWCRQLINVGRTAKRNLRLR